MKVNEFIIQTISQIKNAVDTVSYGNDHIQAMMPEKVSFEIRANGNGDVEDNGDHVIILDINTWQSCDHTMGICRRNKDK